MRYLLRILLAFLVLVPTGAAAQVVRGQILDGETGLPLEGAMVVLMGPNGSLSAVLSDAAGRFLIRAPRAGSFSLRADRIGHASTHSDPFDLAVGDTLDLRMVAEVQAIQLEGVKVTAERRCRLRPGVGEPVAAVWEEARKALAAAVLTEASGLYRYRIVKFLRELDKEGRRVLSEQTQAIQQFRRTPFESLPAEELVREGFFRHDPEGDLYFAPDAKVLLSDAFLDTHCLRLTAGKGGTEGLLGVAFEPVPGRDLPEIRGVVWVDPATSELRRVDYTYENLDPALRSDAVGGEVAFQGFPNGAWIVTEWRIRMPSAALTSDFRGGRQLTLIGIREAGGEVSQVQDERGRTVLEAEKASLTGIVLDSTGLAPLRGATVTLVGTANSAVTDSAGSFRLAGLREGLYSVTISHPSVPRLGGLPKPVEVELEKGKMASIRMVFPPLSRILEAACGNQARPGESAVLTGMVRDGETGEALPGATVRVLWTDPRFGQAAAARGNNPEIRALLGMRNEGLEGAADERGRYLACAVPVDRTLTVEAEFEGMTSGTVTVRVPPGGRFLHKDVVVLRSGTGSLEGLAVAWEDQSPLEGVHISFEDLGVETLSDPEGYFVFEEVPLGRHVIRAEMLGRSTVTDTVQIRPDRALRLEIRIPPAAVAVKGITVEVLSKEGLRARSQGFTGAILDRLTPEEMDELRGRTLNIVDVIRRMGSPRIRITEWGPQGFPLGFCMTWTRRKPTVSAASGCQSMLIVVDGQAIQGGPRLPPSAFVLDLVPEDIESVTVLSPVQAEFRYGIDGGNGALVIETRKGIRAGGQLGATAPGIPGTSGPRW